MSLWFVASGLSSPAFAVSIPLRNAGAHRHGSLVDHVSQSKIVQAIGLCPSIGGWLLIPEPRAQGKR